MAITDGDILTIRIIPTIPTILTTRRTRAIPMVRTIAGFPGMDLFQTRPTLFEQDPIRQRIPTGSQHLRRIPK
jgi:hypothetical protein